MLFQEECGRIASFLDVLYIPNIISSAVLTEEHLATFSRSKTG